MRKIKIMLIIILSALVLFARNAYASTPQVNLEIDKNQIKPGDTFTVTISVNSNSDDSIDGLSSKISYNEDILEMVSSNLVDNENWSELDNFPNLTAIWKTSQKEVSSADIYTITFKVKEEATSQDINISLTDIILSITSGQISIEDINQTVQIKTTTNNDSEDDNNPGSNDDDDNEPSNPGDSDDNEPSNPGDNDDNEPSDSEDGENNKPSDSDDNNSDEPSNSDDESDDKDSKEDNKDNEQKENDSQNEGSEKSLYESKSETPSDPSVSNKIIPFTGGLLSNIILILCGIFTISAIVGYVLYKRYRKI